MPPDVLVETGSLVAWKGQEYVIDRVTEDYHVLARLLDGGADAKIAIAELSPVREDQSRRDGQSIVTISDADWAEARRRFAFVDVLMRRRTRRADIAPLAEEAGVTSSTLYRWVRQYRKLPRLSSLLPYRPDGGRGKHRLSNALEDLVRNVISTFFLNDQQPTVESTVDEVVRRARFVELKPPARGTVRRRIRELRESEKLRKRAHAKQSRAKYDPHPGHYEEAVAPLAVVQIDHTKLDVIIVDEQHRLEIGRPQITLAIDV
ncbi:MAG: helix-turn-helix domain-containing protein, partial [Candidatus Eremiobacteraeota bacterium]|nr:helix-turn-helix domain-containing protein [Candidatus Eremiobacteraeota bacterium]